MEMQMELGKTGIRVPRLGMGVMTWGETKGLKSLTPAKLAYGGAHGLAEETLAFQNSVAGGAPFFDSAAMYSSGASETRLGEIAKNQPVFIATKFPKNFFLSPKKVPAELEGSLKRLGRPHIDLYQHHFPTRTKDIPAIMEHLARAHQEGKIKAIGVSNYSADQMRLAHGILAKHKIPLASNQVQFSLLHRKPETNGVLAACRELGVTLIAYQPLASGALTGKYLSGEKPQGLRKYMGFFSNSKKDHIRPVVEELKRIGEAHGKTPAQVALGWLMHKENVLPIPGAKNGAQAQQNVGALAFSLTKDEMARLDRVSESFK